MEKCNLFTFHEVSPSATVEGAPVGEHLAPGGSPQAEVLLRQRPSGSGCAAVALSTETMSHVSSAQCVQVFHPLVKLFYDQKECRQ